MYCATPLMHGDICMDVEPNENDLTYNEKEYDVIKARRIEDTAFLTEMMILPNLGATIL